MKSFLKEHSYNAMIVFVNQFAIAIFGLVLCLATAMAENTTLQLITSIGAIVFYLFLVYFKLWEIGSKDSVSVEYGKKDKRSLTGLYIGLVANVPNFLLALLFTLGTPFMSDYGWAGSLCAVTKVIMLILEGMYTGILSYFQIGGMPLNSYWWAYFLITVPALLTTMIAYLMGLHNIKMTKWFDYKDPNA